MEKYIASASEMILLFVCLNKIRKIYIPHLFLIYSTVDYRGFSGAGICSVREVAIRWLSSRITLTATNMTARQAINRICVQLKPTMRWDAMSVPGPKGLFGHVLRFRSLGMPTRLSLDKNQRP